MFSTDVEFSSHTTLVNNVMLGNLRSTSHQAKVETAGLKLWKMHLVWTFGIWSKVIEHLDMWGWICTGAVWSLMFAAWRELLHLHVCHGWILWVCRCFFSSPFLKAKRLLMWFHLICCCCTFKAETSSPNRMLVGVSTKLYTSVRNSWALILTLLQSV